MNESISLKCTIPVKVEILVVDFVSTQKDNDNIKATSAKYFIYRQCGNFLSKGGKVAKETCCEIVKECFVLFVLIVLFGHQAVILYKG